MPDEEESRLQDALAECQLASRAALTALAHPSHPVIFNSAAHRELEDAEAAAGLDRDAAGLALREHRDPETASDLDSRV